MTSGSRRSARWLILSASIFGAGCAASGRPIVVTGTIPENWPVGVAGAIAVPLPSGVEVPRALQATICVEGHGEPDRTIAQLEPADPVAGTPERAWMMWTAQAGQPGRKIMVKLEANRPEDRPNAYASRYTDPQVHVSDPAGTGVLSYWHGRPSPDWRLPLTDFIHPIAGLDGQPLTDLSPGDHLHHRGVFWPWSRYECHGQPIGSWWIPENISCEPGEVATVDGPMLTRLAARHWFTHQPKDGEGYGRFLREDLVVRVFKATSLGRAIDVEILLTALQDKVRIGGTLALQKGYGGLTFRYGPATDSRIEADGTSFAKDALLQRAHWADWSGIFKTENGQPRPHREGGAVLVSADHPDCPPPWLFRHYGVLNVSYPGLEMIEVPQEQPLRLRYRLWIHRGDAREGGVDAQHRAYTADFQWQQEQTKQATQHQ